MILAKLKPYREHPEVISPRATTPTHKVLPLGRICWLPSMQPQLPSLGVPQSSFLSVLILLWEGFGALSGTDLLPWDGASTHTVLVVAAGTSTSFRTDTYLP